MSSPASGWLSASYYWEPPLLNDQQQQQQAEFPWSDHSTENDALKADPLLYQQRPDSARTDSTDHENSKGDVSVGNRKRGRDDGTIVPHGKAGREKMRRDRMNDRFVELSAVLEPDKPPKTDKASILRDAARTISQLRAEALQYKEANTQLLETVKELKVEKNELREEKLSLKAEKEILEKRLKSYHGLPGYAAHASAPAVQAAGGSSSSPFTSQGLPLYVKPNAAPAQSSRVDVAGVSAPFATQNHAFYAKPPGMSPYAVPHYTLLSKPPAFPESQFPATMAQWIPPEVADVSNDHVLRPPVA